MLFLLYPCLSSQCVINHCRYSPVRCAAVRAQMRDRFAPRLDKASLIFGFHCWLIRFRLHVTRRPPPFVAPTTVSSSSWRRSANPRRGSDLASTEYQGKMDGSLQKLCRGAAHGKRPISESSEQSPLPLRLLFGASRAVVEPGQVRIVGRPYARKVTPWPSVGLRHQVHHDRLQVTGSSSAETCPGLRSSKTWGITHDLVPSKVPACTRSSPRSARQGSRCWPG